MVSTPWFELKKKTYSTTYIKPSKIRFLLASQDLQCCRFANTICAYQTKDLAWSWNWQPTRQKDISFSDNYQSWKVTSPTWYKKCVMSVLAEASQGKRRKRGNIKREISVGTNHCHRSYVWSKLIGFQNQFRLMWNVHALLRLHTKNFWAHSWYRTNRFCKLCQMWLKR